MGLSIMVGFSDISEKISSSVPLKSFRFNSLYFLSLFRKKSLALRSSFCAISFNSLAVGGVFIYSTILTTAF